MDALCEVGAIDTLLSNFIRPLQGEAIATVKRNPLTSDPILDPAGMALPYLHAATDTALVGDSALLVEDI